MPLTVIAKLIFLLENARGEHDALVIEVHAVVAQTST
jgi:hypothetical protein